MDSVKAIMDKQTMKAYERGMISWAEACRKEADRQAKLGHQDNASMYWKEAENE